MTNIHSSSICTVEDSINSISSACSISNNYVKQQPVRKNNSLIGLMCLLVTTASISSDVAINYSGINPSLSSVYQCSIYDFDNRGNIDVLYDFISTLMNKSEDLDGRIVDMVNEKFWDLI